MPEPGDPVSGLSPSSIDLWEQCPRRFFHEKIERRSTPVGPEAAIGTFVHRVLELLMQRRARVRTTETAKLIATEAWAEVQTGRDAEHFAGLSEEEVRAFKRQAWASVRGYFEIEPPGAVDVIATERWMEAEIEGVPIRGIIDRLDRDAFDDCSLVDYKSGKVPAPPFRGSKFRQLNIYGALVREIDEETPREGRLIFTSHNTVLTTAMDNDTIDDAVEVAVRTWAEVQEAQESEVYEATPGPLCGWCAFIEECPDGLVEIKSRRAQGKLKKTAPAYSLAV